VHYARAQLTYPLPILKEIESEAIAQKVPIVQPEVAALLYSLVRISQANNILEIGSGAAFSTLWMAAALPSSGKLFGMDRDYNRSVIAKQNIGRAGFTDKVSIVQLDAVSPVGQETIIEQGPYDFIFVDCEKRVYPMLWKICSEQLRPGGVLVADNVLFRGMICDEAPVGRNSTGVAALQEFLHLAREDACFTTQLLPLGDGLLVAIKEDIHG